MAHLTSAYSNEQLRDSYQSIELDPVPSIELDPLPSIGFDPLATKLTAVASEDLLPDDDEPSTSTLRPSWYKATIYLTILTSSVFLLNLIFTIWGAAHSHIEGGVGTLFEGSCQRSATLSRWSHILINLLGSSLLASSNYCMQRLLSPARADVDRAHAKGRWLHIGTQSFKNLRHVSKHKVALWCILGLTSIPLHLLYNASVFQVLGVQIPAVIVVSPSWILGTNTSLPIPNPLQVDLKLMNGTDVITYFRRSIEQEPAQWENLTIPECLNRYAAPYVTSGGDLAIVTDYSRDGVIAYAWSVVETSDFCDWNSLDGNHPDPKDWLLWGRRPAYCLSKRTPEACKLQFSVVIALIISTCNLIKALCLVTILLRLDHKPLVTIGDAVESFIEEPDRFTKSTCLLKAYDVQRKLWKPGFKWPNIWKGSRTIHWFQSAPQLHWIASTLFLGVTIGAGYHAYRESMASAYIYKISGAWSLGFGTLNGFNIVNSGTDYGVLTSAILANLPQIGLSFLYLFFNQLLTLMLLTKEWSRFGLRHCSLRVSKAQKQQKSSYWLQLPFKYSIPLLVSMVVLHWTISQSLFLAFLEWHWSSDIPDQLKTPGIGPEQHYDPTSKKYIIGQPVQGLGYSPIAIICSVIVGALLILAILGLGLRKLQMNIPLVRNCSAAISAACHVPPGHECSVQEPIKWGVVENASTHCHARVREGPTPPSHTQGNGPGSSADLSTLRRSVDGPDDPASNFSSSRSETSESVSEEGTIPEDGIFSIGHCCFTNEDIESPRYGQLYM